MTGNEMMTRGWKASGEGSEGGEVARGDAMEAEVEVLVEMEVEALELVTNMMMSIAEAVAETEEWMSKSIELVTFLYYLQMESDYHRSVQRYRMCQSCSQDIVTSMMHIAA